MDRYDELEERIEKIHSDILRLLSQSETLSGVDRQVLRALAQQALQLSQAMRSPCPDREGLISRALAFLKETVSIIVGLQ
jgi:hypothetical protein